MSKLLTVTAAEANRSFSKLLREAANGARVTITSHGRPVAKLIPSEDDEDDRAELRRAVDAMKARWAQSEVRVIGPWAREELYERD
jgi:prevent-host-death family protein